MLVFFLRRRCFVMLGGPSLFLPALLMACCCMAGVCGQKKSGCSVRGSSADCSHLRLESIPADLPGNLTSLDMSHNILRAVPPESVRPYPGLLRLSVSHNTIAKLDGRLCAALPRLQTLDATHNQVLRVEQLSSCSGLTELLLGSNRLRLQEEPFSGLQVPTLPQSSSWLQRFEGCCSFGGTPLRLISINLNVQLIGGLDKAGAHPGFVRVANLGVPRLRQHRSL